MAMRGHLFAAAFFILFGLAPAAADDLAYVEANGIRFAYIEEGSGPLVLLMHGYPETARSWAPVQRDLAAAGYRVVAPNMRGYWPSAAAEDGDYSVPTLGADILALIEALGEEDAVIVGHDWGAAAVYTAATADPAKVRALVALSIPHPLAIAGDPGVLLGAPHFIYYQLPFVRWWVSRNDFAHIDRIYETWSPTLDISTVDLTDIKTSLAEGGVDGPLGYYWSFFGGGAEGAVRATPESKITVPSLVIAGDADGAIAVERFAAAAPAFTGSYRYVELADVGHFPQIEAPDAVSAAILDFLRAPPAVRQGD